MSNKEEETQKAVFDAFRRIGEVWGQARKGIIVAFNGTRVGTWVWNSGRMLIKSEDKDFKVLIDNLQKLGVMVREPVKNLVQSDSKLGNISSTLVTVPLGSIAPGTLDHVLKLEGYFVIDLQSATVK